MHFLANRKGAGIEKRPDWMPDEGVYRFVLDMLEEFGVDANYYPSSTLPIIIVGTMDWVAISGWWIFEYTGIFDTEESSRWIFEYDGHYEFDPDQLLVFREDPARNGFRERYEHPGLREEETREAVQFVMQDCFQQWGKEPPTQLFVEVSIYATLMWIMSEHARPWLESLDPLLQHVYQKGVAYLSAWQNELLDPKLMRCTRRPVNSCSTCEGEVWCVEGMYIGASWVFTCHNCAVARVRAGEEFDTKDGRVRDPGCPEFGGRCLAVSCQHHPETVESLRQKFREEGSRRVEEFREQMRLGGSPRKLAGQSVEDLVEHFRGKED